MSHVERRCLKRSITVTWKVLKGAAYITEISDNNVWFTVCRYVRDSNSSTEGSGGHKDRWVNNRDLESPIAVPQKHSHASLSGYGNIERAVTIQIRNGKSVDKWHGWQFRLNDPARVERTIASTNQ